MKKYQYRAIHTAIVAVYGKPEKCEICNGKNKSKRYEWSNKDHQYTLIREDWWSLCATCHRRFDRQQFGHKTWNKGRSGFQKNHNISGLKSGGWNKGLRSKTFIICLCGKEFYPPKLSSRFCSKSCVSKNRYLLENKLMEVSP